MLFHNRDKTMPYFNLLEILTLKNINKFKVPLFTYKFTNVALIKHPGFRSYSLKPLS